MRRRRAARAFLALAIPALACGRVPEPVPPAAPPRAAASAPLGDLSRLALGRTAKGPEGHGFTDLYERFLFERRQEPLRILEIGIDQGGSLRMWADYFPRAEVFGIDILDCSSMETERIRTFVADQSKRDQLGAFLAKFPGSFDLVLDDGGHSMEQQQVSLGFLFAHVKPGGLYVVEDVHTSLPAFYPHRGFGVDADGGNTTLRMLETFFRTGRIESRYMTPDEARLVESEVDSTNLFQRPGPPPRLTCLLRRRAAR